MASSQEPDDDFGVRVEKVFRSLKPVHSSDSTSLWSVSDTEVKKRDQNREGKKGTEKDEENDVVLGSEDREGLEAESGDGRREADGGFEDRGDGGVRGGVENAGAGDGEEWEIRSSIGMDRTLDDEEEEDLFDKVAVGRENAGDRIYMRDATDHGTGLNSHNVLTQSHDATKDPRIDHFAAQIGLKEDIVEAQNFNSPQSCCKSALDVKEPQHQESAHGGVKSILKRKGDTTIPKSQKRVKFDLSRNDYNEAPTRAKDFFSTDASLVEIEVSEDDSLLTRNTQGVPDYVLNSSKYTHYTLDSSSDVIEDSKSQACVELLEQMKRSKAEELGLELKDNSVDLPKSLTFIPKKKVCDAKVADSSSQKKNQDAGCKGSLHQTGFPIGIAAGEVHQTEAGIDEEPDAIPADKSPGFKNPSRHYRMKTTSDD